MPHIKTNHKECVHVAIGFDQNYLDPVRALLHSLIANHGYGQLEIHAIAVGITSETKTDLSVLLEKSGNRIVYYSVDESRVSSFVLSSQWTSAVYYRLFLPLLIGKEVQRLIYLDCDTIVTKSLWPLYSSPMDGYPVAAVFDNYVKLQPLLDIGEGAYFNSGVLLIDILAWKEQRITEQACDYLKAHPENILYVDQCALNMALRNNWKKLDPRFNLLYSYLPEPMGQNQMIALLKENVVVHFTIQRPWQMLCKNRLRYLYFHHLKASGVRKDGSAKYTDFRIKNLPGWVNIRLKEFYSDMPFLQKAWRLINLR